MNRKTFIVFISLFLISPLLCGADTIIGGETVYIVQPGDSYKYIGAKLGVHWKNIAKENNLDPNQEPTPGMALKINTRKIVPKTVDNGIIINIPDRTLYFFKDGTLLAVPVGLGLNFHSEFGNWNTPTGKFRITNKRKNPTWYVPESIQLELADKGKEFDLVVPPGPKNPLGKYALVTSLPGVLIHGTISPKSVYRFMSHGCIRVLPEHIEQLFNLVEVRTQGEIVYQPVKVATQNNGSIFLEVRSDIYRKIPSLRNEIERVLKEKNLTDKVDWQKIETLIKNETGIAEEVSLGGQTEQKTIFMTEEPKKLSLSEKVLLFFRSYLNKSQ